MSLLLDLAKAPCRRPLIGLFFAQFHLSKRDLEASFNRIRDGRGWPNCRAARNIVAARDSFVPCGLMTK
jgi:hypothetical protein